MKTRFARFLFVAWALSVVGSLYAMALYESTPGEGPASSQIKFPATANAASDKPTLMMFLHPRCPCSVASVQELSTLMEQCGNRVSATVLFFQPSNEAGDWSHTALWHDAAAIPGVVVTTDIDARVARRAGAQTSGEVLLYSATGRLLFEGGITRSRGHVGGNESLDALERLIIHPASTVNAVVQSPVFGCAIYATESKPIKSVDSR